MALIGFQDLGPYCWGRDNGKINFSPKAVELKIMTKNIF